MSRFWLVNLLTLTRLPLVALGYGAALAGDGLATVTLALTAVATDIADGVLARRWGVTSERGANFDSFADFIFYASLLYWVYLFYPAEIQAHARLISVFFALYVLALAGGLVLKHSIAVHDRMSRAAGTAGATGALAIIAFGYEEWVLFVTALFLTADLAHRLHSIVQALGRRRRGVRT